MQIFTSAANFLPTATMGWMIENGFLQRSDLWAAVTNPAVAKRITKEFCTSWSMPRCSGCIAGP